MSLRGSQEPWLLQLHSEAKQHEDKMMGSKGPVDHCKKQTCPLYGRQDIDFTWPNNKFVELLLMKVC